MRVHFIVHESFEAPGAYETWAINQGHDVTYSRVYAGDRLPDDAVGIDFLIVMGGPQDLLWSSFFGHADQMVGLCTGGQLGGR
ncbi:glutamine amidotransferase, partial [Klebsiella pneumoniae]